MQAHYLLSTCQPNLCWTFVGQAIRLGQRQGVHLPSFSELYSPTENESRRRAWAATVILEATCSTALGLPPSIAPEDCFKTPPSFLEDYSLDQDKAETSRQHHQFSSISFFTQSFILYRIQIKVLRALYSSAQKSTASWPDIQTILEIDEELDTWETHLPPQLRYTESQAQSIEFELEMLRHVLHARFLHVRLLLYRPIIFHLCQRTGTGDILGTAPSKLHRRLAQSGVGLGCSTSINLVHLITRNWSRGVMGAWCA